MADGRRRTAKTGGDGKSSVNGGNENAAIATEDDKPSTVDSEIGRLRGRWELASVLNFLSVFEPVIGGDLKLTAEDIESGLVTPNSSNAALHIKLLKGIPPVHKNLNGTDAWVTVLCKKLAMWWPWVAEGEMPLNVDNGKEISGYKELNPTNRLLILKALCELRAEQDDVLSYINDALKNGTAVSNFRKDKVGGVGGSTTYWYDASKIIGHRLYKGVSKIELKTPTKGKSSKRMPATSFHWETIATNLEEFQAVVGELSSSKVLEEVAVGKTIDNDFIPALVKLQKKKEMALKRKQREENLINNFRPYTGSMRSCRNRRTISYTFDDYDRAIDEAIKVTRDSKRLRGQKSEMHRKEEEIGSDGDSDDGKGLNGKREDSETESDRLQDDGNNNDMEDDDDDYDDKKVDIKSDSEPGNSDEEKAGCGDKHDKDQSLKRFGSRWSMRLAGVAASNPGLETGNIDAKNKLRQRPSDNSSLMERGSDDADDSVVPDSDESLVKDAKSGSSANEEDASQVADSEEQDENSSQHENSGLSVHEELSEVADSEEDSDG